MNKEDILKILYKIEEDLTKEINSGRYNEDNLDKIDGDISTLINDLEELTESEHEGGKEEC